MRGSGQAVRGALARLALGTIVLGSAVLAAPLRAGASVGTGVGADPIVLAETAHAGQSYTLPALYLVNTGTETSQYAVRVLRLDQGKQRNVPASWIVVPTRPISLAPKAATNVPLTLDVPADAAAGDYMTDVVAGTVAAAGGSAGASVGTQAATQLHFSVGAGNGWLPWPPPDWALVVLLAAAVVVLGRLAVRSGLRIHVERTR
jgi:hypothetical protein